jgi:hypothetical protein
VREEFRFGRYYFDLDLVRRHIAAGDVPFELKQVNITEWASKSMGLDRTHPDHKPVSVLININYDHLATITPERLTVPIILVTIVIQKMEYHLIIDGNHRVAKAYLSGMDELPAYVFDLKATEKLDGPVKLKRKKGV